MNFAENTLKGNRVICICPVGTVYGSNRCCVFIVRLVGVRHIVYIVMSRPYGADVKGGLVQLPYCVPTGLLSYAKYYEHKKNLRGLHEGFEVSSGFEPLYAVLQTAA